MTKVPNQSDFRAPHASFRRQLDHVFEASLGRAALDEITNTAFPDWASLASFIGAQMLDDSIQVLGVSGSQGSGKSTFANVLVETLETAGARAATLSLDDFYLTKAERIDLCESVHPLLRTRGVPGTHDAEWLLDTLLAHRTGRSVTVPRFNKGQDDRQGKVSLEVDFLVLEGWCLGVQPESGEALLDPVNQLEQIEDEAGVWRRWVNDQIARYSPSWQAVDYWIQLRVPSFAQVYEWREEQERSIPVEERMSSSELRRFVQHYERLTRHLWSSPPLAPGLLVDLDANHNVSDITLAREG
ncbi:MAG: kinase [Pseudomonadales bacterium]|nr:kinase [Pseudomonadales bacterium]